MKPEEANKIIAEYMGDKGFEVILYNETKTPFKTLQGITNYHVHYDKKRGDPKKFSKSLDALVPVWEKLNLEIKPQRLAGFWKCGISNLDTGFFIPSHNSETYEKLEEAAAIATAKAIQELK